MANAKTIQVNLKAVADVKDVLGNVKQIQSALGQLKLPDALRANFTKVFADIEKSANKASLALENGFKSKSDATSYGRSMEYINSLLVQLQNNMSKITPDHLKNSLNVDVTSLQQAQQLIKDIQNQLNAKIEASGLEKVVNAARELAQISKAKSIQGFVDAFSKGDLEGATKALQKLEQAQAKVTDPEKLNVYQATIQTLSQSLKSLQTDAEVQGLVTQLTQAQEALENLNSSELQNLQSTMENITKKQLPEFIAQEGRLATATSKTAIEQQQVNAELDQFKSKITYFFGMNNVVHLFQRALHSAYSTIKDLDKVMTETAVVTDFSVGDMWSQLPEYTQRANELGVSIHSAYEAATLYYQQGLRTNEVVAVSNETLKMARIAGLDAATATDRMTNALRGFNMEINAANAQNINDVYSKLAAITASDVDEISTAMTKVASLANNANMDFETTAAFLSQIIETTRESAETAGTALKTVIARFSEVKSLYSEGELTGKDSEGEEIDVNKVSQALRSAGINLNEYLTGMKGLDDIFIELSSKWDSLDQVQQRYIATMAAGSRQQSRFIALMSDYARTTELVQAATTASGASEDQFGKTLESLETKLNKLKNAWDEFTMGLANSDLVKGAVDAITWIIDALNKLTSTMGTTGGAVSKLLIAFIGLKIGKSLFSKLIDNFLTQFISVGQQSGIGFLTGFKQKVNAKNFAGWFKKEVPKIATELQNALNTAGGAKLSLTSVVGNLSAGDLQPITNDIARQFKEKLNFGQLTGDQLTQANKALADFNTNLSNSAMSATDALKPLSDELATVNADLEVTPEMAQHAGSSLSNNFMSASAACMMLTMALGAVSNLLAKGGYDKAANAVQKLASAFGILGGILIVLPALCKAVGIAVSTIPIIGWIAAIITLLISLGSIIADFIESDSEKAERLAEATKAAAEAAQQAAENYQNLKESLSQLEEDTNTIQTLTSGTQEWRDAVKNVNQQIMDLIDKYPELARFVKIENGVLGWADQSAVDDIISKYEEASYKSSSAASAIAIKSLEANAKDQFNKLNHTSIWWELIPIAGSIIDATRNNAQVATDAGGGSSNLGDQKLTEDLAKMLVGDQDTLKKYGYESTGDDLVKFVKNFAKSQGKVISATEQTVADLKLFGQSLVDAKLKTDAFYNSMAANAVDLQAGNLTQAEINQMSTYLTTERMGQAVQTAQSSIGTGKNDWKDDAEYQAYFKRVYGDDVKFGNRGKVTYTDENGNKQTLEADEANAAYAAAKATEEVGKIGINFIKTLQKDYKNGSAFKKIYDKAEGKALNQNDIEALSNGADIRQIYNGTIDIDTIAKAAFDGLSDEMKTFYQEDGADFIQEYKDALTMASETYVKSMQELEDLGIDTDFDKRISSGAIKGLTANLTDVFVASGRDISNQMVDEINTVVSSITDTQDVEKFVQALGGIDWKNYNEVEAFSDTIDQLGLTVKYNLTNLDDLENRIIEAAKAIQEIDFEELRQEVKDLNELGYKLSTGVQSTQFTEDQKNQLISQGIAADQDFLFNIATGTYDYISDGADRIVQAIRDQTTNLLTGKDLKNSIAVGNAASTVNSKVKPSDQKTTYYWSAGDASEHGFATQDEAVEALRASGRMGYRSAVVKSEGGMWEASDYYNWFNSYFKALGSDAQASPISKEAIEIAKNDLSKLTEYYNTINQYTLELSKNTEELNERLLLQTTLNAQYDDPMSNANKIGSTIKNADAYANALLLQANAANIAASEIEAYQKALKHNSSIRDAAKRIASIIKVYQEAATWGINTSDLQAYAEVTGGNYTQALRDFNLNQGYSDLVSKYKDWSNSLLGSNAKITSVEYQQALISLAGMLGQMLNTDAIDANNITAKVVELAQKAAQGDLGAISKLQSELGLGSLDSNYIAKLNTSTINSANDNKSKFYTNTYTELYNLNERINEQIRQREKLERKYQETLANELNTLAEIRKSYDTQIDALKREKGIQNNRSSTALGLINSLASRYSDVAQYANYQNGELYVDITGLENLDEETGKRFEEYLKYLEQYSKEYEEAIDALDDIQDSIDDISQQSIDSYISFEERVMDAYVTAKEKEIDALENATNALNDANSKLIAKIQQQINDQRQARDNAQAESDISDMESRLAYLRRDTSGANQLEIMQLEKELEQARQEYNDNRIDQAIQQMQDDADVAAEQRATQISVMRQQLAQAQETGELWKPVHQLITDAFTGGKINPDSELVKLLQGKDNFGSLSSAAQAQWLENITAALNTAAIGSREVDTKYDGVSGINISITPITNKKTKHYARGGLVDSTGPAWLDGSKSNPEMVLSPIDTRNFMALRDVLAKLLSSNNLGTVGDAYYDIDINAEINSDYDVDKLAERIKKQITDSSAYRNVNTMNFIR